MMATWWKDCLLNHLTQVWYITLSFYSRGLNWIQLIALINYVVHPFQFQILDGSLSVYFIKVQSIHLKTPNRRRTCRVTVNLWRTQFYHILRNGTRMPPIHFTSWFSSPTKSCMQSWKHDSLPIHAPIYIFTLKGLNLNLRQSRWHASSQAKVTLPWGLTITPSTFSSHCRPFSGLALVTFRECMSVTFSDCVCACMWRRVGEASGGLNHTVWALCWMDRAWLWAERVLYALTHTLSRVCTLSSILPTNG